MNNEIDFRKESLLPCPFTLSCHLPKANEVCDFPNYKMCSEYQSALNKLKITSKILH
ncbi:MAG: hypothetical protein KGD74_05650 [Candidatus Lokiarchaeota archaeon]|nr:hypothetical protein [Candidatus Lokiarchaeota archaeon]